MSTIKDELIHIVGQERVSTDKTVLYAYSRDVSLVTGMPDYVCSPGKYRRGGSSMFSFRVFTIESKGHTPFHQHPFEHMNYVIQGHGAVITESGKEREIKKGDFVLVLPNEKHQYKNTSQDELLSLICALPKEFE